MQHLVGVQITSQTTNAFNKAVKRGQRTNGTENPNRNTNNFYFYLGLFVVLVLRLSSARYKVDFDT